MNGHLLIGENATRGIFALTAFTDGEILIVMDLTTILDSLGGDAKVAEALNLKGASAISNWKARGLPPGRKFDLLALSEKRGIRLTIADIEKADAAIVRARRITKPGAV